MRAIAEKLPEFDAHEKVIRIEEPDTGLLGFIAIHRRRGTWPSLGATRLWAYGSELDALRDALRLSRLMTYKSAMAGFPYGGAKAVLIADPHGTCDPGALFGSYAEKVNELQGDFVTGSDVGVGERDVELMRQRSPYVIGRGIRAEYYTALGALYGIEELLRELFGFASLHGRSFGIQGLGKTGMELLKLLAENGARRITVSDPDGARIGEARDAFPFISVSSPDGIHKEVVDIFCPCALSHAVNFNSIPEFRCKGIVGTANNQLESSDAGKRLHERGILYAPDYLVNSGGLISVADQYEHSGHDEKRILGRLSAMRRTLRGILAKSRTTGTAVSIVSDGTADAMLLPSASRRSDASHEVLHNLRTRPARYWTERGEASVLKLFTGAAERVPAYKDFLADNGIRPGDVRTYADFKRLPPTSKDNYLRRFPLEDLTWDGKLREGRWVFSSTSGSTGEPFYFPRTRFQDRRFALTAELALREYFEISRKSTLFIDCFALGVWIGGVFMYQAIKYLIDSGAYCMSVITPGADKMEAIKAVKNLGSHFDQVVIGGYGPLVKDLIDIGIREGLDWNAYDMKYFFAAEGFTEGFREYVARYGGVKNILQGTFNHYGTADLGTMAHETPLSILIRRLAVKDPALYEHIFSQAQRLPTLTQFLPEFFFFEETEGRLLCSGLGGLPLVRYDLKDRGGVITFEDMVQRCRECGVDILAQAERSGIARTVWRLPFVYVYERNDFTVSIYSVNIYPEAIRRALEASELETFLTGKFTMLVDFDEQQNQYFEIHAELKFGEAANEWLEEKVLASVIGRLEEENSEWRDFYNDRSIRHKITPRIMLRPYQDPVYFKPGGKQKWVRK